MTVAVHRPPTFTEQQAGTVARALWGIDAHAARLPSERDQNFVLDTGSGPAFVLKISQSNEDRSLLECQNALLEHLARAGTNVDAVSGPRARASTDRPLSRFCFPRVVESRNGALVERITADDGTAHWARVFTFVPGAPLATLRRYDLALLQDVGRMIGAVTCALADFDHPSAHRILHWDLRHGEAVIEERIAAVVDAERSTLLARFLPLFRNSAARFGQLHTSVVHGDANDYNILVEDRRTSPSHGFVEVTGLIDAGDVVHSWTVGDLAIACAYAMLGQRDPLAAARHVVQGYRELRQLGDDEAGALYPLICLRLCASAVLAAWQLRERPDNAYLSISEAPVWVLLSRLAETRTSLVHATFHDSRDTTHASAQVRETPALLARRARVIGPSLSVAYRQPLTIVRGWMQSLFDERGEAYLDAVNNVAHVGHGHPRVVDALSRQAAMLNTNTRYLHENLVRYAERLAATLPEPLAVCYFVCSGSEANELALRMARTHTARRDVIVLDAAYHGNTSSLIDMSPYKLRGPGGSPPPSWVHVAPLPDPYRGRYRQQDSAEARDETAGHLYAREVERIIERLVAEGRPPAAFFAEPLPGCGGQIVPPAGFLRDAFLAVRAAGSVCVADEVQTGLGRVGSHFWAFQTQDAIPDIVTAGKPIGNGHPLGAVITTREIAASFANGMEYFNTFGGNPVSCAAGMAVLDVIEDEGLQEHAWRVGERLMSGLRTLVPRHDAIGDVRGRGLYIGVELVDDRRERAPARTLAADVVNRMREQHILISTDGPDHNVLKIKPPLVFMPADADRLVETLDRVLAETHSRSGAG